MWNAAHSVIGPTRNVSSYIHTNRDATLRSVAAAVTFARTSSVRPRGSDASITPTFVSHSGRFAARSMTIQTLRYRPAAWASIERNEYRSSSHPSPVGLRGYTRSGRAEPFRPTPPDPGTRSGRRGRPGATARQTHERAVVGDEPDVDLGTDSDHVVLPTSRDEVTLGVEHRVVGDVDADTLDLTPHGLRPVTADTHRVVGGVGGVTRTEHRTAEHRANAAVRRGRVREDRQTRRVTVPQRDDLSRRRERPGVQVRHRTQRRQEARVGVRRTGRGVVDRLRGRTRQVVEVRERSADTVQRSQIERAGQRARKATQELVEQARQV